ncbi:hypothetical protein OQX61_15695 [Pedobacter sp. PLR]|uniref:hypothetical protein n=1 Tax=Pedobacter sp. PLR TaxID=2994465 RepID=UPI002246066C|nr:hypothetical protein [Pedobacter sp. PLR]MCX2452722.1 hypothetical protein [Pedobacter sp. PLR]
MQKSPQQRFLFILGLVMFTFYFVLGLLLIFWTDIPFEIQKTYRILFGVLLIVYAAIRFARLINPKDD